MPNYRCCSRMAFSRHFWFAALLSCLFPTSAFTQAQIADPVNQQSQVHGSFSTRHHPQTVNGVEFPPTQDTFKKPDPSPMDLKMSSLTAMRNASSNPKVQLTGFVQMDAGWFAQSQSNRLAVGDIQDGADFRRARLAAKGSLQDNLTYMAEFDFASQGRPNFMDVWLQYSDSGNGNWRLGQFRHPFGMDGQTSIKELPFLERGLPFAFLPFRQIGLMYWQQSQDKRGTFAASGFRFPTDSFGGNVGDNGGYGLAIRSTRLLMDSDGQLLHIGGGFSFGDPANDQVRYRNQPEFFVAETGGAGIVPSGVPSNVPTFVDTGSITTRSFQLFNGELGFARDSFHAQAEGFVANVNQIGRSAVTFPGGYIQLGYVLTGETRHYNRKNGVFGTVDPHCDFGEGIGAVEIVSRLSYIDLNDKNILGGELLNFTVGANWYWNNYTKFQFNYILSDLQSSSVTSGSIIKNSSANIFAFRMQFQF